MYTKKQHIARKTIITCLAFLGGVSSTIFAAAVYDASVQTRANNIFDAVKKNASTMNESDATSYYNLVRLNIKSLVEVLTVVDGKILTEIGSTLPGLDDSSLIGELTATGNIGTGNTDLQCTTQYSPVCGEIAVQCISVPCPPIKQTFSNTCIAISKNAKNITNGACESSSEVSNDKPVSGTPSLETSCQKKIVVGNLTICDTGKKSEHASREIINSLCPTGLHVPNYWEMKYLVESGIKLDLDKNATYYINSLYGDIVKSPGYPFNGYPYTFIQSGYMNHSNDLKRQFNILCISNAGLPTVSMDGVKSCKITQDFLNANVSGKYLKQDIDRENLIEGESLTLDSNQTLVTKGNIDFTLNLSCNNGNITKTEMIKKINNCAYGYTNINNDCKVDPLVCNSENLGNVHPTNSKVCSWKELATKEYFIYDHNGVLQKTFRWNSISNNKELETIKQDWENISKNTLREQYRSFYNNKIDINLDCNVKQTGEYDLKFSYVCKVNGLFWQ